MTTPTSTANPVITSASDVDRAFDAWHADTGRSEYAFFKLGWRSLPALRLYVERAVRERTVPTTTSVI